MNPAACGRNALLPTWRVRGHFCFNRKRSLEQRSRRYCVVDVNVETVIVPSTSHGRVGEFTPPAFSVVVTIAPLVAAYEAQRRIEPRPVPTAPARTTDPLKRRRSRTTAVKAARS